MKSLVQNGILLVVSVAVALVLCEVMVRVFDLGPEIQAVSFENHAISENPILGYELVPNSRDGAVSINGDGMRDRDYPVQKPEDTFRIAVVGDSITFGFNVEARDTYAKKLEGLLNRNLAGAMQFEVMNFGVSGYNVIQVAENLRTRALKYDPDLILYGYCLNDPQAYSHEMENLLDRMGTEAKHYVNTRRYTHGLLARSKLFLLTRYVLASSAGNARADGDGPGIRRDPQVTAITRGNYAGYFKGLHGPGDGLQRLRQGLRAVSGAADVPVVAAIFPIFGDLENYPLTAVHETVKREFQDSGHRVIDLLGPYARAMIQTDHGLNYEPLHPTPEGHLFAAGVIAKYLVGNGMLAGVRREDVTLILSDPQLLDTGFSKVLAAVPDQRVLQTD